MPGWAVERGVEAVLRARDKRAVASADAVLCNSRYTAAAAENAYGRRPNVAYLGIDDVTFNPETGDAGRRNRVLSVGGLEAFKGHHLAVEAISQLPGAIRPELHLVYQRCDEVYRDELLDLARSLGVKIVEHRDITDAALAGLYATSRATVLAAALEPFGLVALESSACGTPVVAVRQGGYLETVVDGENGLLVDRTPEAIVDGLRRVLEGELDRSPLEIRQTVLSSWHWDEAVARQVSFLASVAGKPQP
jgi:glycosyltransferase involved in cell wall biosynthesis